MGEDLNWYYDTLPYVKLAMGGKLTMKPDDDFDDDKKRSHFDQYFNWRIDEENDEFLIRFKRKRGAPRSGHINVDLKIEGGLSQQPDGSVVFDGGLGNGDANGVSKFGLLFEISHESNSEEAEPEEEPEEKEIQFFDHEHKLRLAPEYHYEDVYLGRGSCDACMGSIEKANARWVYECADCDYGVHAACAQRARTIRHPSHPKHTLKLLKLQPGSYRECDVCKNKIRRGLHYNCAKCDFDLHPECPEDGDADADADVTPNTTSALLQQMQMMRLQQMSSQMQLNAATQTAACMINAGRAMVDLC